MQTDARYLVNMEDETVQDLQSGESAPVVAWVGLDGYDCDKDSASVLVAGPFGDGFLTIDMDDGEEVTLH